MYKLSRKYPANHILQENFQVLKKQFSSAIKSAKSKFYSSKIQSAIDKPSILWDYFYELLNNQKKPFKDRLPTRIVLNNTTYMNKLDIAHIFNKYFVSVGNNLTDNFNSHITCIPTSSLQRMQSFHNVSIEEVRSIILTLNSNTSCGYDNVKARFIKNNIEYFAPLLCSSINDSIKTGLFPNCLKTAKVTPVYKSGDKTNVSNYRPISVLSIFSKIHEIAFKNQLNSFLNRHGIINRNQYGFLNKSSTAGAATNLMHKILHNIEGGNKTACVFLDIRKAFDCVMYDILKIDLYNLGITDLALDLLCSYLHDRRQFVMMDNIASANCNITNGVPQGSVLGPILFLIYINGIFSLKLHGTLQCFADDTAITYGEKDLVTLRRKMTEDLSSIQDWLFQRNLQLNTSKTKFMIFKKSSVYEEQFFSVQFNDTSISSVQSYNYLGLHIDELLSFGEHVKEILRMISPYVHILKKIRYTLDKKSLELLYYAYIHSKLTYLLPIWSSSSNKLLSTLLFAQNKALRTIYFRPWLYPTKLLYSNILSINQLKVYESIMLIHKIKNGLLKSNLQFQTNALTSKRNTRTSQNLRPPNYRSSFGQKSVIYNGINLYNGLPDEIKKCSQLSMFKSKLKKYVASSFSAK
jgi:hypothetical protein